MINREAEVPHRCDRETRTPVPGRPGLIEVRCPHFIDPLRYEQESPSAAQ